MVYTSRLVGSASIAVLASLLAIGCGGDIDGSSSGAEEAAALVCAPGVAAVDADGDGMADCREALLAARYAPIVHLYPSEGAAPASVDWYLARSRMLFAHHKCPHDVLAPSGSLSAGDLAKMSHPVANQGAWDFAPICQHSQLLLHANQANPQFYLTPGEGIGDATHAGSPRPSDWVTYVHVRPQFGDTETRSQLTSIVIQYWFFYPYQDAWGPVDHESDWEHFTVSLFPNGRFSSAYFTEHGYGSWYLAEQIRWSGSHPHIYSARGTHATYRTAGSFKVGGVPVIDFYDHTSERGPVWNTVSHLVQAGERTHPARGQEWILYGGLWGRPGTTPATSGIITPSFQPAWQSGL